jgi:Flp pilus assembly protein TadD
MSTTDKKTVALAPQVPAQNTEGLLLERLNNSATDEDYFRWMLFVVGFYRGINKVESATELLQSFIRRSNNHEQTAHCHLALGQIATDEQRFDAALTHFGAALELGPKNGKVTYVLHNNMAYCLNMVGRFAEGESRCRMAIEINWTRASGYRNLGVSFQGQSNVVGAAWALVEAVKADASDSRARSMLEKLITGNPTIAVQCPWAVQGLNEDVKSNGDSFLN